MSGYKYDEDLHHISKIQFSVFTNDDIKDYSSVMKDDNGINLPESYENSEPKRGGLVDTRLGITDANLDCAYCGLGAKDCPGHFGHTKLVAPVFHYGFFPIVKNILSCICLRSSRLLAHKVPEDLNKIVRLFKGKKRFNEIKKLSSSISVSDVGVPVPKIKEEKKKNSGALYLVAETSLSNVVSEDGTLENNKPVREKITASDVYNIFRNVSDDDFRILGFNPSLFRPEDLLLTNFPVPPVAIRPSLRADYLASATYEDDLTHKLADIIKTNEKYRQQKEKELVSGEESKYGSDLHNYLQYHVITYFDNDKSSFLTSEQKVGNKKFKSISERIKSKKGRIRGNLMGKRVNFSARSVITSDPNLKLNELGIPKKIAMEITFPEVVTAYNVERLTKLVRNGRYIYPGANYVIQGSSLGSSNIREYDLRYRKKSIKLKYGDIVERHLYNGDPVLFNRQPSLHKLSMMCHRAKIIDDERFNTFRLNVNVTPPYNADFDGDEMNLFAPQSIQTQTELALIADINKLIISPKDSEPIIEPVQDSVLGTYKMTSPTSVVDWHDFMNIAVHCIGINFEKLKIEKNKSYTGTQLYNIIIPDQINLDTSIKVTNGDIVKGQVRKKANKQIISNSWDRHGPKITADYITDIQKINVNWILYDGFSVGLADCFINKDVKHKIISELEKKKLEIAHLITEIENNPELLDAEVFEQSVKSNLAAQKGDIQQLVMNDLDDNNNFFIMANSGAKGKPVNLMQIMGALGQDIFKGKRIEKEVNNRTLPHFHQNDDTPLARGYIEHSYLDGLSPQEFFFHHMTGREGLIDTAIKTAETGYISRKLMKGLEDVGAKYDGTVRTGNNMILQYIYSDFNLDQTKQKLIKLKTIQMGDTELEKEYSLSESEIKKAVKEGKSNVEILRQLNKKYLDDLIGFRNLMRITQRVMNLNYKTLLNEFHFAVNLPRIIADEIAIVRDEDKNEFCPPKYIIDQIEYVLKPDVTQITTFNDIILNDKDSIKMKDEKRSKLLFKYYLYEYLCPKKLIFDHKLTKYKFDKVIEQIVVDFKKSQVDAGEMVGCLAAQHMGEPSTQMSVSKETIIYILINNNKTNTLSIFKGDIGSFVDNLMEKHKNRTFPTGHKDSYETLLDQDENDFYVLGVNENETTSFNKISHVSRHPTNGDLMEIKTRSGRKITTTYSHSHLTRAENKVVPILGSELKKGHRIPVAKNIKLELPTINFVKIGDQEVELNELFGWFIGAYLAEGSIIGEYGVKITSIKKQFQENTSKVARIFNKKANMRTYNGEYGPGVDTSISHKPLVDFLIENCDKGSFNKRVPDFAYAAPEEFTKGLLRGYFDGDGNVQCDDLHHYLRGCSRSEKLIKDLGLLYAYKGICVNYLVEENKRRSDLYHYIIPYKYVDLYYENIGTDDPEKLEIIMNLIKYNNRENAHDKAEYIDKICGLGDLIAKCGKDLKLPGQSRNYGRWKKKSSIGRGTLLKYIKIFDEANKSNPVVSREINLLKQAANSDVIWDEIIEINNIKDPKEYVYDFTVPNNQTFLTSEGIIVHNTLNTFHATGSGSAAMQGVPRVEELTRATKNIKTPEMTIYLDKSIRADRNKANIISSNIQYTIIKDLVLDYEMIYDIDTNTSGYTKIDNVSNPFFVNLKSGTKKYENMIWLLRIKLDRNKIIEKNVTTLDIKSSYISFFKNYLGESRSLKRHEKKILSAITGSCILSNFDNNDNPVVHIRFDMIEFNSNLLLGINEWIINNFKLKGLDDIQKTDIDSTSRLISFENDDNAFEESSEIVIYTQGINMTDIRYINGIDLNRTYCNEINTIRKYFGIEAARSALLKELYRVFSDQNVNFHHLAILVDTMTNLGFLTSIDRHGINKLDTDPLSRASFEMPIEQLTKAATFGEIDYMRSVSSRVMAGRVISGGTGLCSLLLDTEYVMNSEYIDDETALQRSEFNMLEDNIVLKDIISRAIFDIFKPKLS